MNRCSRDADRNSIASNRIDPIARLDVYLDERHDEVCAVAFHLKQTAAEKDACE